MNHTVFFPSKSHPHHKVLPVFCPQHKEGTTQQDIVNFYNVSNATAQNTT
jgi:hypothetical protein